MSNQTTLRTASIAIASLCLAFALFITAAPQAAHATASDGAPLGSHITHSGSVAFDKAQIGKFTFSSVDLDNDSHSAEGKKHSWLVEVGGTYVMLNAYLITESEAPYLASYSNSELELSTYLLCSELLRGTGLSVSESSLRVSTNSKGVRYATISGTSTGGDVSFALVPHKDGRTLVFMIVDAGSYSDYLAAQLLLTDITTSLKFESSASWSTVSIR